MKGIVIYGAGNYINKYMEELENVIDHILMIVDGASDKVGKELLGFKVKSKEELRTLSEDITVAIASRTFYEEIKNNIQDINPKLKCTTLIDALFTLSTVKGYCNLCDTPVGFWMRIGKDIKTAYNIIGNGSRRGSCPLCGCYDRNRWQYYVLKHYTNILDQNSKVLHFAPEAQLLPKLRGKDNTNYYTADIQEGRADYVVDITDIQFEDSTFDYIIANHVLEHIPEEEKTVSELIRCLKDDGTIVLSFPYCKEIDTLVDDQITSEEDRVKYYGQRDHVRLYGRDYKERLEKYGLIVRSFKPVDLLDKQAIFENAFIEDDIILLCRKR